MANSPVIGGEFDIDLTGLRDTEKDKNFMGGVYKYASGRSALYYILLDAQARYGVTTVFLPDYLCSSVVFAVKKSQMRIVFYSLDKQLEIDIDRFPMQKDEQAAVLLINYFGLKKLDRQISFVRDLSQQAVVIEDDVQAFYEFHLPDLVSDYKFTSLRKTFPCPDGGLVKTCNELAEIRRSNTFYQYKLAGGVLKSLRKPEYYDDAVFLQLFENGEDLIDDEITDGMSEVSLKIMKEVDLLQVAHARQRNANMVVEGLRTLGIETLLPIPENSIPLFIPIWLANRDKVRKAMFSNKIFCPVHWPLEGMEIQKGAEMANHEMSIIIDQRYTSKDMEYILTTLEKALK